jgi:MFS family permease
VRHSFRIPAAERGKCRESGRSKYSEFTCRLAPLRERNFRRFYAGYATSLLGTSLSSVAIAFAVLDSGGTATSLGLVFAAGIVPQVVFLLHGGVIADRLGRRPVMLSADVLRFCAQGTLAAALVQFTLFNLITWGPFLVLGPVLASRYLGGARAWGLIMAGYGAGAVAGGLLALGRSPRRPVRASVIASFGYAAPPLLLALHAPAAAIAAGAVLAAGAAWAVACSAAVLAVPGVHRVAWRDR